MFSQEKRSGRFLNRTVTEEVFLKDISKHSMQVIREDGIYRHLRFRNPKTTDMMFDIITWPGYLCYTGDMGTYVFKRVDDMLTFFRDKDEQGPLYINPGYWSEKVEGRDRDGVAEYSPARFREAILEHLTDSDVSEAVRLAVVEDILPVADEGEDAARRAVSDFHEEDFEFTDFWETDCSVYTDRYLWCCYALPWAIRLYDQQHVRAAA